MVVIFLLAVGFGLFCRWICLSIFDSIFKTEKETPIHIHYHNHLSITNQSVTIKERTARRQQITKSESSSSY
jgi:hypothetical protein